MALQSSDETTRIAVEFFERGYCPPNIIKDGELGFNNANAILNECMRRHGLLSISGLQESAYSLGAEGKLALIPPPPSAPALTPTQIRERQAQEALDRQRRDYIESTKPQPDFMAKVAVANKAKEEADAAKAVDATLNELEAVVNAYQCYGLGSVDFSGTEMVKKAIRSLPIYVNRRQNPKVALKRVRDIISNIPDHPRNGDLEAVNQRLIEREELSKTPTKSANDTYRWNEPIR
jgi:hypothetical protein